MDVATMGDMPSVVRLHINGVTYTHASATTLTDATITAIVAAMDWSQLTTPLKRLTIDIKTVDGTGQLVVFPYRVATFATWVANPTILTNNGILDLSLNL